MFLCPLLWFEGTPEKPLTFLPAFAGPVFGANC